MNESSLLNEGQEAGPVFTPSESFTRLPSVCTQSKASNKDRAGPSRDDRSARADNTGWLGIHFYLSQPSLRGKTLSCG